MAVAASYLAHGLQHGEQCLYAGPDPPAVARFRQALTSLGIDAGAAVDSGALLLRHSADTHLLGGTFDSERMLRMLNDTLEQALNSGFTGLRTCGDMSWLLDSPPGAEQVIVYEALLNEFFRDVRASGMCQYDRRRLPHGLLDHALATHGSMASRVAHVENPFIEPPRVAMHRQAAAPAAVEAKIRTLLQLEGGATGSQPHLS